MLKPKYNSIIYLIIIVALVYGLGSIFYHKVIIADVDYTPLTGAVTYGDDILILNFINVTEIDLGRMKPGMAAKVNKPIYNDNSFPVNVKLEAIGPIRNFVNLEPSEFVMEPGEKKKYYITFLFFYISSNKFDNIFCKSTRSIDVRYTHLF